MLSLLELFCHVDDFCQVFLPHWKQSLLESGNTKRQRCRSLSESEIMTILIAFHSSHYRDFKAFYQGYVCQHWKSEFPGVVSYNRFIECIPAVLVALYTYLETLKAKGTSLSFLDATDLSVCDNHRISQHKVFKGIAKRGKTSTGYFFGFKLHIVVNDQGGLLNYCLTAGNVDDRKPVPNLLLGLLGKVYADKGYVSQSLFEQLFAKGIHLVTKAKKNRKPQLMPLWDRIMLRKRAIIESVVDQLKNISPVEHTRHRAYTGFLWNLAAARIAYCHQPKKPSLHLNQRQINILN